jgi:hypothetical protein
MEKVGKVESLQEIIAEMTETTETNDRASADCPSPSLSARSDAQRTSNSEPVIKSQIQSGPEPNIDKKIQLFQRPLALYSTMAGVCSALVEAQNKHSRGLKMGSALAFQAAFANINIRKSRSVY